MAIFVLVNRDGFPIYWASSREALENYIDREPNYFRGSAILRVINADPGVVATV
jgi:hypothetical protein